MQDRRGAECHCADPSTCAWFSVGSSPLHLSHVTLNCAVGLTGGNEPPQLADAKDAGGEVKCPSELHSWSTDLLGCPLTSLGPGSQLPILSNMQCLLISTDISHAPPSIPPPARICSALTFCHLYLN